MERKQPAQRGWRHAGALVAAALVGAPGPGVAEGVAASGAPASGPPRSLRDTGLFVAGSAERVAADNLPYAPQYGLWSDGASKRRWIHLPAGAAIDAVRPDDWQFPAGTRFWKEFSVGGRRVETRMLERLDDGAWRFAAYVWNAAGTDATLAPARGATTDVEVAKGARHEIPAETDCRSCHEGRPTPVLGFSALQLSPDRDPGAPHAEPVPAGGVDLRGLVARGLVTGLPAAVVAHPPRIQAKSATARAALGYLASNCGGCHNEIGPLAALQLTLDGAADAAPVLASTVGRSSQFRLPGAGESVRIAAGQPAQSLLVARMRSREPLVQMPPLGSKTVDAAGIALIERWIREEVRSPSALEQKTH